MFNILDTQDMSFSGEMINIVIFVLNGKEDRLATTYVCSKLELVIRDRF